MNSTHTTKTGCPPEVVLSDYLAGKLSADVKDALERHIADCEDCLVRLVSCFEAVEQFRQETKQRSAVMNTHANWYLSGAIVSFILSFLFPLYFIQFLVAASVLAMKWIVDSRNTKILITIYEAWKKGGEKEASRVLERLDGESKNRL